MMLMINVDHWLQYFYNFFILACPYFFLKFKMAWDLLNDYVYWRAGLLLVIGYFIALSLSKDIPYLIGKVSKIVKFSPGEDIARLTGPFIFRLTFLVGINIAAQSFELTESQGAIVFSIVTTLVIASIFFYANQLSKLTLKTLAQEENIKTPKVIQSEILPILEYTSLIFLAMMALYSIFKIWGIEMTALLASAGVIGLAVSMAAKDTLSDIIAGILILTDAPFKLGDNIEIKGGVGKIVNIGLRSTRIRTSQNIEIIIPNGKIGASEIINKSAHLKNSLEISLPVKAAYGVDPKIIREILIGVAKQNKNIVLGATISVSLEDFNQSQTTFILSCQIIEGSLRGSTLSSMREEIYLEFLSQQIDVALPEDVSIKQFPYIFSSGQPRELPSFNVRSVK